jgi:Protein of unknown function (DUF3891)
VLISRREPGQLCVVTQPDHAAVAGALAQHWGNPEFAPGSRQQSLIAAATRHDDGWATIDGAPAILEAEGRPAHFLELDLADTVAPYGAGVDRLYADDVYAGILTSRHWAGLYSSRWGVQDSPPVGHPAALAVVEEQEARAARHSRALWDGDGLRSAFERGLWHDYEVLQALDLLSLALCLIELERPTAADAPALAVPATLRGIEQPPGGRLIPNVPTTGGEHVVVALTVPRPGVVELDPYPFDLPTVAGRIRARLLDDVRRDDAAAVAAAFHEAPVVSLEFALVPGHR